MNKLLACLRLSLGWVFFWAGIDKIWGFGYATPSDKGWLDGVSPTAGFLTNAPNAWFRPLGGNPLIDWLFVIGLVGIGTSLILGIAMRIATASGTLLMFLMWLALWPLEHNPLIDEHIIYALVLLLLSQSSAGNTWGLGRYWQSNQLIQKLPWLR